MATSRRHFFGQAAAVSAGVALTSPAVEAIAAVDAPGPGLVEVAFKVNGERRKLSADPRVTLLDALRERLQLTGTKKGCDRGQCGACTVHVDGRRVLSCLTLTATLQGKEVTTIEGIADGDELHPVQRAFIDHDGFQCGFCTSGQIMSAVEVVEEREVRTDDQIREAMSGNICRCGAYPNILDAIKQAKKGRP
ncbi:(2Fe-2S)-binding protein [Lentzea sp. PSKA42]|jgi:xanthine dehydrogenase YagT iron-sulfur-binding subunit|uniref:(2Fe-2S)-binding protein n=1 Tax=Lentzea indica TaxID=2604800 RepID=A0ABX1FCZ4_9PSEU|nr:(2Fe-2S)-binding protein [Lentzea indica]NKE56591.1 (2Fe-2S)-binding protein [Lentzea indica]